MQEATQSSGRGSGVSSRLPSARLGDDHGSAIGYSVVPGAAAAAERQRRSAEAKRLISTWQRSLPQRSNFQLSKFHFIIFLVTICERRTFAITFSISSISSASFVKINY